MRELNHQNVWVCYEGKLSGISPSVLTLPPRDVIDQTKKQTTAQKKAPDASGADETNLWRDFRAVLMSRAYRDVACDTAGGVASETAA